MKKALALALSLSLAGFAAQAQTPAAPAQAATAKANGPAISFTEMKYDFGKIKQGDVVEHTFKFKNTGTAPLVISNIGTSCGCTTPDWTKDPIMPGKTGSITAKFNSAGKLGMQNKVLTIESNAAGGSTMVSLVGEILDPAAAPAETAVEAKTKTKETETKTKVKAKKS
ncbi:DUF1573 domain-containing protein [Hymenobacter latericus]|uniref:DUF1573 domain-containing protein n=1 Tax=Hymenobacter sp. YIM 151858-1 TaxID=2987688 RepID=UPI0029D412B9|nr:DUF1573 domain-containing protein [Hymenobacter sp. YIM 151858-1]